MYGRMQGSRVALMLGVHVLSHPLQVHAGDLPHWGGTLPNIRNTLNKKSTSHSESENSGEYRRIGEIASRTRARTP